MSDDAVQLRRQLDQLQDQMRDRRRAEELLRQSEERFRSLVEHTRDIVYRLRLQPRLHFEYVSPVVVELLGITAGELYDDPRCAVARIHAQDRHLLQAFIDKGDFSQPLALRWRRGDGRELWLQQHALPVFDDDGRLLILEGIVRDVSNVRHVLEGTDDSEVSAATWSRSHPPMN